ncbi:MAG: hypothetical protein IT186_23900 [Acidobacteria bacterium]|nr:hypothetical protein [Acidobacteriota bacterium]MCG3194802.1 hypothetical protein [Thermoanaerobaculia bacterium]
MTDAPEFLDNVFEEALPAVGAGGDVLIDFIAFPVAVADASGALVRLNPVLSTLLGRGQDELAGRPVVSLFDPVSHDAVRRLLQIAGEAGRTIEVELRLLGRSGSVLARGAVAGRFDPGGALSETVWSFRQPEPLPVLSGGARAEWLATTLGDVTSDFASLSSTFEEGLKKALWCLESTPGWTVSPELKATHARLSETLGGLKRFGDEMGSLNRLVSPRAPLPGPVDPSTCLERAARIVGRSLRTARVRLRNDIPEPPPLVWADEDRLTEVFLLILISGRDALRRSRDASGEESTVARKRSIQVETGTLPPWVQILVSNNARALLSEPVEDFRTLGRSTLNRAGIRALAEAAEILRGLGGALMYQPLGEAGNRSILTLRQA